MLQSLKRQILNRGAYFISYIKLQKVLKHINQDSLVIDCGANVGEISGLFLSKGAEVIAFEPDPLAFGVLQKRFAGNARIKCINKGVADYSGTAQFYMHKARNQDSGSEFTVSSSIIKDKVNISNQNKIEIELEDIDTFINNLNRKVDVVKMDVEGAEIDILEKMLLNKTYEKIGLLLVETHETKIPGHLEKVQSLKQRLNKQKISNIKLNWI